MEDLQKSGSTSIAGDTSPPAPAPSRGERPPSVSSTGLPTLDYHVYEEIMYDLMTSQAKAQSAPPPLPARPETLRKQAVPPGPGTSISAYAHSMTRQANQRSNIYSIFRDQGVRRGISESLEIEAQRPPAATSTSTRRPAPHPPDFLTDDEYGFLASRWEQLRFYFTTPSFISLFNAYKLSPQGDRPIPPRPFFNNASGNVIVIRV